MKKLRGRIFFFLGLYLALVVVVFVAQRRLIYFPGQEPFQDCARRNPRLRPVLIKGNSNIGSEVRYHVKAAQAPIANIVLYHGNAGTACDRAEYPEIFPDLDVNWFFVEYPGYAGSPQAITEEAVLASSVAAFNEIQLTESKQLPTFVLGESLGTGVATYIASLFEVAGLVLISPYTSISDLAASHYWFLPVRLLIRDSYEAHSWARKVAAPTLILHGTRDEVIDVKFGRMQSTVFGAHAQFIALPNSGHNDWMIADDELARLSVTNFVQSRLASMK